MLFTYILRINKNIIFYKILYLSNNYCILVLHLIIISYIDVRRINLGNTKLNRYYRQGQCRPTEICCPSVGNNSSSITPGTSWFNTSLDLPVSTSSTVPQISQQCGIRGSRIVNRIVADESNSFYLKKKTIVTNILF